MQTPAAYSRTPAPPQHSRGDPTNAHPVVPQRGDPRNLLSYQKTCVIYDITVRFAKKYLGKGDRTVDQMVQAARSGKQNISEGGEAGRTSTETEIKLTNVAYASLGELLDDYLDFLRVRDAIIWDKNSEEARYVRELGRITPQTFEVYQKFFETRPPETVANIVICLIHQARYLLDRQINALEAEFLRQGGLRERMTAARLQSRGRTRVP
jgi:four helix bundle suffix protein